MLAKLKTLDKEIRDINSSLDYELLTTSDIKAYIGETADVLLERASVLISPTSAQLDVSQWVGGELGAVAGKHYGSAYTRSAGIQLRPDLYGLTREDARLFGDIIQTGEGEFHRQIIGGQSRLRHIGRQLGGWGTWGVSRFNRLLEMPFETPPFSTVFGKIEPYLKKIAGKRLLAVEYSGGLEMLGRLSAKYGIGAAGIALGYKTIDYQLRQSEILEGTTLGTGITGTLGTGLVQANLLASRTADLFGLHGYREAQEELAPGSTDLSRLIATDFEGSVILTNKVGVEYCKKSLVHVPIVKLRLALTSSTFFP